VGISIPLIRKHISSHLNYNNITISSKDMPNKGLRNLAENFKLGSSEVSNTLLSLKLEVIQGHMIHFLKAHILAFRNIVLLEPLRPCGGVQSMLNEVIS
jgi:hypothetical protein